MVERLRLTGLQHVWGRREQPWSRVSKDLNSGWQWLITFPAWPGLDRGGLGRKWDLMRIMKTLAKRVSPWGVKQLGYFQQRRQANIEIRRNHITFPPLCGCPLLCMPQSVTVAANTPRGPLYISTLRYTTKLPKMMDGKSFSTKWPFSTHRNRGTFLFLLLLRWSAAQPMHREGWGITQSETHQSLEFPRGLWARVVSSTEPLAKKLLQREQHSSSRDKKIKYTLILHLSLI